jgi:sterol desaturase/sphingolipid hydroxylase (fatty acid hydroxylase superfamily)
MGQALASNPLFTMRFPLAGAFLLLIAGELVYRTLALKKLPSLKTTATDTFIWVVEGSARGASIGLRWLVFSWVAQFAPFHLEASWWSGILAYLIIDFIYYWKHRFFHSTKLGWALHSTHHTTRQLTFLSTLRLNWIEAFLSYYFFLPLALVGFDPLMLFFLIEINDAWQVVCHTEVFGRIPLWERFINHPDFHRVHHSRDPKLANCNYTSTLILWDKLFGTYHPPAKEMACGVEDEPVTSNPFVIQFGPLWRLLFGKR